MPPETPQPDNYAYDASAEDTGRSGKLDLGPGIHLILERIWLVLMMALFVGAGGTFLAFKKEDIYRAVATLHVASEEQKLMSMEDVAGEEFRTVDALNTIAQRLRHSSVLLRVVRTHTLTNNVAFKGLTESQTVRALAIIVQAKVRAGTRLIDISVEHRHQDIVDIIANSVAQQFIRESLDQKLQANQTANLVLIEEADRLKNKLEAWERALQVYKEKNKAASLEEQQNIIIESLKKLNADYTAAKSERLQIEADLNQIQKAGADAAAILVLPSVARDPTIQSMHSRVVDQETLVASMTSKYKPKYPKMAQALRQLEDMRKSLNQIILSSRETIKSSYDAAMARERSLDQAVKEAELETLALNKLAIDYNVLTRQMESERALYDAVLKRIKETDLAKGLEKNAITLAEPANRPSMPYKPDRVKMIVASCIIGVVLSIGFVFLLNFVDNTIKTVDQAETLLGVPVIGAIPVAKLARKSKHRQTVIEEPHSICAESFRSLIAAIDMAGRLEEGRVVLFTSALPTEGKTFASINYAIAHAQKGRRTLLIDFDLRRPCVAETFGFANDHAGVTDFLLGKAPLDNLCTPVAEVEHLFILAAGPRVPNPAEQIARPWVSELIKEACSKFDRVVIDTAPLNAVADTSYLLPFAQVIILIIRAGKTPLKAVRRTIQVLKRSNITPSGLVLNCLPQRGGYGYYYYYSSGGYNSTGVYSFGEDSRNGKSSKNSRKQPTSEVAPPAKPPGPSS